MLRALIIVFVLVLSQSAWADFQSTEKKLIAALEQESRSDKDKERDANRAPVSTLKFLGFKDDMNVLELVPGRGWYTQLLAPTLSEKGTLYAAIGTTYVKDNLLSQEPYKKIKVLDIKETISRVEDSRLFTVPDFQFGVEGIDMILTFRNYHNFDDSGRMAMNTAAFAALKSGGVYGVVDHTRRHMQGDSDENWRRIDPVLVIKEVQAAGFEFVDYADNLYRADDELRYEVGRKSVAGNTDRFTLKFIKP